MKIQFTQILGNNFVNIPTRTIGRLNGMSSGYHFSGILLNDMRSAML